MKKKMQQWAAVCLSLALAFCLGLPVWAEDPETYGITLGQKGKIILKWEAGDTEEKSVTATAYQVIRVDYDYDGNVPKSPEFYWVEKVADWVKTSSHSDYINQADNSVPEKFKGGSVTAEDMKKFAGDMAQAIRGGVEITGLTPAATVTGTGSITFSGLDMGAYLILLEGGTKIYEPVFVSIVPTWDEKKNAWNLNDLEMYVTAKSQALTLRKTVFDNQGQPLGPQDYENGGSACAQVKIGDIVTYMLVADVPAYPADAVNTGYQISDNLPEGMTLNKGSVKVYGLDENTPDNAEGAEIDTRDILITEGAKRPVTDTPSVTFNLNFTYNAIKNYAKIRVVYTAKANENLKTIGQDNNGAGNVNTAYLDYNNNPYGDGSTWETQTGTATVYSYGIIVQKVDKSDGRTPLLGAKFTLKKSGESSEIRFVGSNGVYRVATAGENGSSEILEVGDNENQMGKLVLSGLDVGTYELTETKAPAGYIKLSAPVTITITDADPNGLVDDGSASADGTDGYVELTVENGKGFTLPSTGGMGTMLFTAIGTVLMGGGLVLLLLYLRRRNRQE